MITKVYAIKDNKIAFMKPFHMQNDGLAIREFTNGAAEKEPNAINTNPEDKELWRLGEFDDETGEFKNDKKFLIKAMDVIGGGK